MTTKFLLSSDDNTRSGLLKKKIIHYYMANGDATIAEVCKEMNLSIPTVTKLISELQEDGYILDFGKQETSGGRKPSIYGLNPVSGYFVGVDILKDQLNLAILDFKGDKIRIEQNIPYTLENTPAALDHLCECINEFINSLPIPREKILSIGINISGRVNPFAGYSYSIFYFEEKPLSQILEEKLHIKIYIENDTRSMAYGEYLQGVVKGEKNILFINISWGLGIGIIKGSFYNDNPFEAGDENVMEAILKERLREFFFEGKRWYDLRRFGKDYVLKYTTAQESRLLWPINEGALTNNPALKQTPGY